VDGHDARIKLAVLANTLFPGGITLQEIACRGIREISPEHIREAARENLRWKLIADLQVHNGHLLAAVQPQKLPLADPLAQVAGTGNALVFTTDLLGELTISGPGAGRVATGYGILSDLLTIKTGQLS
jgi:homoserine dehydrogenase